MSFLAIVIAPIPRMIRTSEAASERIRHGWVVDSTRIVLFCTTTARQPQPAGSPGAKRQALSRRIAEEARMDYFQVVVADHLSAGRAVFVNAECCRLNPGDSLKIGGQQVATDRSVATP